MRAHTHGGWAHRQQVSTTFLTWKHSHKFSLWSWWGSNLRLSNIESNALSTEPPHHQKDNKSVLWDGPPGQTWTQHWSQSIWPAAKMHQCIWFWPFHYSHHYCVFVGEEPVYILVDTMTDSDTKSNTEGTNFQIIIMLICFAFYIYWYSVHVLCCVQFVWHLNLSKALTGWLYYKYNYNV